MGSRQVSRQGGVLGHAGPIPQVMGCQIPCLEPDIGMRLPVCRQGTAPGTSRGHTGLGEDMVPPPVSRHVTTPLSSPLRLTAGPFLLPHLPSLCGLHVKVSGPTSGLCGLVTWPSLPPSASSPAAPAHALLPWLPLDQPSHWHALRASLRAGGTGTTDGASGLPRRHSLRVEEPALLQGLLPTPGGLPQYPPFTPRPPLLHEQGLRGLYRR